MKPDAVGRRRLLKLAAVLDETNPDHFDMTVWGCRTAACALGTAALIPSFRKQGLRLKRSDRRRWLPAPGKVTFRRHHGILAAMEFFRLDYPAAAAIFLFGSARTRPDEVANRIRGLIRLEATP
jgi:hypothetical protein